MIVPYLIDDDPLIIGNRRFFSRLMLGTGKYQNFEEASLSYSFEKFFDSQKACPSWV